MREMQKIEWLACGMAAVWLAAGCASVKQDPVTAGAPAAPTNAPAASAEALTNAPPAGGYTWETLARLAAANCGEAKALLLEAQAERHQTAVDTGWRNPQLRVGQHWGDEDQETAGRTGMRTYPGETDSPSRPFSRYREWDDSSFDGYTAGLRVYLSNPFVNRWLRKRGAASARALEARSDETAYAVFCEVRSLCLDAEVASEEIALLEQMAGYRAQVRDFRQEQASAGVANALELIRAETRLASLRSEIHERQTARLQVLRRISVLSGVPADRLRLRPADFTARVRSEFLDGAVLTDLAFTRRPDLTRARHEQEAAEHGVRAAQAKNIPWFEYVEGTYEDESGTTSSYEQYVSGHDTTSEDRTEWQARMAVTLPVFNWLGDEVKLSRSQLAAARARVEGLYDTIRAEVGGVLDDYRSAQAERERLAEEYRRLRTAMTARIDALANEAAARREDVLAAREELTAYQRICMKAECECLRLEQYLETVSGGTLTAEK